MLMQTDVIQIGILTMIDVEGCRIPIVQYLNPVTMRSPQKGRPKKRPLPKLAVLYIGMVTVDKPMVKRCEKTTCWVGRS